LILPFIDTSVNLNYFFRQFALGSD